MQDGSKVCQTAFSQLSLILTLESLTINHQALPFFTQEPSLDA